MFLQKLFLCIKLGSALGEENRLLIIISPYAGRSLWDIKILKNKIEFSFGTLILGPFWVVCSIPHDATYFFYLSNNQFQMLYDMVVTPKNGAIWFSWSDFV